MANKHTTAILDLGDDLQFTGFDRRDCGGTWVSGRLAGHAFQALVFPGHAENPDHEIAGSRISKLWVQRIADRKVVVNWDRGADLAAADNTVQAIVDFLCEGIADAAYPE